ncbi:DUF596 domain-containing protein [Serratia plymuthica]|uniref:DUF596 domain-containing protein n=1 Tax=Serratia plymuthica TaxID=82996 RepID=A0A2X4UXD5_SERPL|nr:DUF596 domain-containing protein [Serratia plymuthica]QPS19655.1 DUF596 domain-containing protein [Serratia plymuthica]QPS61367.1 DUF596 domain-containing protein [Serratia plymuthica]RKS61564.1 hypothetical protein C8E17_0698 [Serratia plymuthica]CAI2463156.1 Uncharacterized protein conserved in bacteria [Serratia plymuthica]SQI44527.1 Uncharacterized protein conserved in bacteria [Serratia plymuthica]
MLTIEQYENRKEALEGASMVTIWENIHPDSLSGKISLSFNDEKELFLWFIERLMNEGKVKLGSGGMLLTGTVKEQVDKFRASFPNTPEEMEYGVFNGYWFLSDACPAGLVWIHESGYKDWT